MKLYIARAGKILSGWQDPAQDVYCASLDSITNTENAQSLKNWMSLLFSTVGVPELESDGKLRDFRPVMLAALLKDHKFMVTTYGNDNRLVQRMIDSGRIFGFTSEMLIDWSEKIAADWRSKNATNFRRSDFTSQHEKQTIAIQEVAKKVDNINTNMATTEEVPEVRDELCTVKRQQSRIIELLQRLVEQDESPRKKRRGNEPSPARAAAPLAAAAALFSAEPMTERQAAQKDSFAVMTAAATPANPFKNDAHLLGTALRTLLKMLVKNRIDWTNGGKQPIFGKNVGRQLKSKVLTLLNTVHNAGKNGALVPTACFSADQKAYLLGTNIPADKKSAGYGAYTEFAAKIYVSVGLKFMTYFAMEWNRMANVYNARNVTDAKTGKPKKMTKKTFRNVNSGKGARRLESFVGPLVSAIENLVQYKKEISTI